MKQRIQAKNWVFTLNNYTQDDENRLKEMECEWLIYAHEHQKEGTPHLQGAICFKGKRDFNALQKLFKWHIEVMHGSPQDSKTYCTKEDTTGYFEKGQIPQSKGKKGSAEAQKKWKDAIELAKQANWQEIEDKYPSWWVAHQNHFKQIYCDSLKEEPMIELGDKDLKKRFLWLWGPTGTGKSHSAYRIAKELGCEKPYLKDLNKWWDNYKCQKVTIIEEADEESCKRLASRFKKWCDKWPFTAEGKGISFEQLRPQYIIVTSNYPIDVCFPLQDDNGPMHRRMTEVYLDSIQKHVYWPKNQVELEFENGAESLGAPGNTIPVLQKNKEAETGIEPEAKRQKIDDDVNETGLIEPPAILDHTPSDFNSEEC